MRLLNEGRLVHSLIHCEVNSSGLGISTSQLTEVSRTNPWLSIKHADEYHDSVTMSHKGLGGGVNCVNFPPESLNVLFAQH